MLEFLFAKMRHGAFMLLDHSAKKERSKVTELRIL